MVSGRLTHGHRLAVWPPATPSRLKVYPKCRRLSHSFSPASRPPSGPLRDSRLNNSDTLSPPVRFVFIGCLCASSLPSLFLLSLRFSRPFKSQGWHYGAPVSFSNPSWARAQTNYACKALNHHERAPKTDRRIAITGIFKRPTISTQRQRAKPMSQPRSARRFAGAPSWARAAALAPQRRLRHTDSMPKADSRRAQATRGAPRPAHRVGPKNTTAA